MKYNDYENYFERNKSCMEEFLKQKKKKNSLGFIIMALIGILLFIVLAAGAIYVLDDDTNEKTYTAKQNFDAGGVLERRNY